MTDKEARAAKRDLSKTLSGTVTTTSDPGFQVSVSIDNGRVNRRPLLVVVPMSTDDIANTVKYCRAQGLRLTTKSGGEWGFLSH